MDFLQQLNEAQKEAVINYKGPSMVIAGAGSGKTRVLTYRIAYLIKEGVDPFNILALTFTNKAAREMKERISNIVGESDAKNIWMGTFHSIFARILRVEADKIGYPRNFTIYDTQDSKNLLRNIIKELGLDEKIYKTGLVYSRISSAKNNLISARSYINNDDIVAQDRMSAKPKIGEIYIQYEKRCFQAGAMDFDDLLFKTNILLRDFDEVLLKYQHRFKYILVDEYQDTNFSQYLIVKKLAALNENLCVVGDDAQSIYAFRGANIQNILGFQKDYPDFKQYKLEQNYRSTKMIVNAANSVIEKNRDQIKKEVWTSNIEGNRIPVIQTSTDNEEGKIIAQDIYDKKAEAGAENKDFAILYRTNAQSRAFEEALRKQNIPYKIYGGLSFYQRKEIKDLLAYFRLTANHKDEESLRRVINYPKRGIGKTTMEKVALTANEKGAALWEVLDTPEKYELHLPSGTRRKINEFTTMIKSFRSELEKKNAYDLGSHIAQSSGIMKELYSDKTPEGISRHENLQELLNGLKEFAEAGTEEEPNYLSDFLVDVALLTDADNESEEDFDKVSLMTIHAAKGLEFPYVYIVGLEENLFPSQMALNTRSELEEERRLFYVALTRAEKAATLSYAKTRYRWGNLIMCEPSRFIEEIDPDFVELPEEDDVFSGSFDETPWDSPFPSGKTKSKKQNSKKESSRTKKEPPKRFGRKKLVKMSSAQSSGAQKTNEEDIQVGTSVKHGRFGKGKVINLEGNPPNIKATVFFPSVGQKQLLLKFAKLEVLD